MRSPFRQVRLTRSLIVTLALALVAPAAVPAAAQSQDEGGTARLSFVEGRVTIGRGSSGGGSAAQAGASVRDADYVATDAASRAEVQLDDASRVRLGENVQLRVVSLGADDRDLQLAAGTVDLRLVQAANGNTTIETPSVEVIPEDAGSYRITVDEHGTTFVTVRSGHAEIDTPHGARPLDPGSTLVADGTSSNPAITKRDAVAYDAFDTFNDQLDRQSSTVAIAPEPAAAPAAALPSYAQPNASPAFGYAPIPSYAQPYVAYAPVYVPAYAYAPPAAYGYVAYRYAYPRAVVRVYARPASAVPVRVGVWAAFGGARVRAYR
jgi:hypothetical protein